MGSTPNGLPYPDLGVAPDVPYWMQQLAEAVEARISDKVFVKEYTTGVPVSGYVTVTHTAGFTPKAVFAQLKTPACDIATVDNLTSTTFRVLLVNASGAPWTTAVTIYAQCWR